MEPALYAAAWLSTLTDLVVAAWLLHRSSRRTGEKNVGLSSLTFGSLVRPVLLTGLVFLLKLPVLVLAGLRLFGLIHLAYLDLAVTLPILGLLLLTAGHVRSGPLRLPPAEWSVRLLGLGMALVAPLAIYATWIEPFRLQLETVPVSLAQDRQGSTLVRVGVLSDIHLLHVGEYERQAFERVMALSPDLIVLAGDLFQGDQQQFEQELPALRDLLRRLAAPSGVFLVLGNVDERARVERLVAGTEAKLLVNELAQTTAGDRRVTIGGIEEDEGAPRAVEMIRQLETLPGPDDIRLLVTHRPDGVLRMQRSSRIDLALAGHTHGGQIQLPLLGPLMTLSSVPRRIAAGGLHDVGDGRRIYVSRGVGFERGQAPRVRFLCPPEVALLELGAS